MLVLLSSALFVQTRVKFRLNGKSLLKNTGAVIGVPVQVEGLSSLQQGWNHFVIRELHAMGTINSKPNLFAANSNSSMIS